MTRRLYHEDSYQRRFDANVVAHVTTRGRPRSDGVARRPAVVAAIPADPELLRSVAAKLTSAGRDAILTTTDEASPTVVVFRAAGSPLDCGALWKKIAQAAGGRGRRSSASIDGSSLRTSSSSRSAGSSGESTSRRNLSIAAGTSAGPQEN